MISYKGAPRTTLARINLLGVTFIAAWHTTLPFVALYAQSLGAPPPTVGLIISATIVLPLLVGIYIGAAVDIVGVAGIARWSSLLFAAAYVVMVVGEGLRSLALGLAMVGLADSGLVVASQTYVAAYSAPADRDRNFGSYTIWVSLGALLGPILGGVLADRWGYRAVFAGSLVLGVLTALVCWSLPRQRTQSPAGERRFTGTLRAAIDMLRQPAILRVMLINACAMFAFSLRQSFYPVYLQSIGFSTTLMGTIFSFHSACSIVVRPTIAAAVTRLGHRGVLALALMLTVLGASLTPMLRQAWALALAVGLAGAAMGYMQPLSMSLISGRAMAGTQGLALGLRISMNQLAQVIAPPIYGLAVAGYGIASAFYVAAAVAACGFIGLNRMARWQETSPERGPGRSSSSDVLR